MSEQNSNDSCLKIQQSIIKKFKKTIWHRFIGGCKDYKLIKSGDVIAVCISGGKDSFLLAKCMQQLQKHSDVPFQLKFLCMDPGYNKQNRLLIEENANKLGIELNIFETDIFDSVANIEKSPCYLCARMRRGHLYKNARALGCNKIALGHHFDDTVETALMSMIWGAEIKTMPPKLHSANYSGMELIRPMYLVRECDIIAWVKYNGLQFLQCACRLTERTGKEELGARKTTKELVRHIRTLNPAADYNIFKSLHNINLDMTLGYVKNGETFGFNDIYTEGIACRCKGNEKLMQTEGAAQSNEQTVKQMVVEKTQRNSIKNIEVQLNKEIKHHKEKEEIPMEDFVPGTPVMFENCENFRELGGYTGRGGKKVKRGLIYRTAALAGIYSEEDVHAFNSLGIKTAFDFRSSSERDEQPDPEFDGVENISISAMYDENGNEVLFDLAKIFGDGRNGIDVMLAEVRAAYRTMPFNNPAYKMMFEQICAGNMPLLFHCSAGKDRTGVAAALILRALGVSDEQIFTDYMLTNVLRPKTREYFKKKYAKFLPGEDMETITHSILGVELDMLETSLNVIDEKYDDFEEYLRKECDVTSEMLANMRRDLLV